MIDADEMISVVRAGFAAEADLAAKRKAAAVLRAALAFLEPADAKPGAAAGPPAPAAANATDVLAAVIERFKPLLPPDLSAAIPRLDIPLVPVGR